MVLHGAPLRVAILQNGVCRSIGPFLSRASLRKALDGIEPAEPSDAVSASLLVDALVANAPQLGSKWSCVVVVGELPFVDSTVADLASAMLIRVFTAQKLRVYWLSSSGPSNVRQAVSSAASAAVPSPSTGDLLSQISDNSQLFFRADWTPTPPTAGFVTFQTEISDAEGKVIQVPDVAVAAGTTLHSLEHYAEVEKELAEALVRLNQASLTDAEVQKIREPMLAAFQLNPVDPPALRVAISLFEKVKDYPMAIKYGRALVVTAPLDGSAYASLGHALLLGSELDESEAALKRASELHATPALLAEDLARIHIGRNDDRGTLPYLDQALQAEPKRQDLWFLQAQVAYRIPENALAIDSLEQGLALGGIHIAETLSLIRLYLTGKQSERAMHRDRIALADLRFRTQLLHCFKVAPISFSQETVRYADRVFGNDSIGG